MVPEKLRALYVTGLTQAILRARIRLAGKIVCVTTFAEIPNAAPLPPHFPCC
jgi:hypothetical protein